MTDHGLRKPPIVNSLDRIDVRNKELRSIARHVEPLSVHALGQDAVAAFEADGTVSAIPVFEDGAPIGLLNRNRVFLSFARQFGYAVFAKRPVHKLMIASPFVIDAATPLDSFRRRLIDEAPDAIDDGFIIMDGPDYLGIGNAIGILRLGMAQAEMRNRELVAAKRDAEAANAAKTRFLANISHELRTPLNAIIGFSEMIAEEVMGTVAPTVYRTYADDINASGRLLLDIINDVLDMAKIDSGQFQIALENVSVADVVPAIVRLIGEIGKGKQVSVAVSMPDGLPGLCADPRALRQILMNLLSNAVKFSHPGGEVRLIVAADGDAVEIRVEDDGIGIPADKIDLVLQPFVQVEEAMTRSQQGTGLGLPIVKTLTERQGAAFMLESEYGKGTTARLRFPRAGEG